MNRNNRAPAPQQPSTVQLIRWLASITAPVHRPLAVSTLLRVLTQLLDIALFAAAGWSVATVLVGGYTGAVFLGVPVAGWILLPSLALARALTHYGEQFTGHYVAFKALELLRGHAFSQLWRRAPLPAGRGAPADRESSMHSGSLLTGLTRDVDRIEVVYAHTLAPLVSAILVPTLTLAVSSYTFGFTVIALPTLCLLISIFVVPAAGFRASRTATDDTLTHRAKLTVHTSDSVHGVSEVLTYGRQQQRADTMKALGDRVLSSSLVSARIRANRRAGNILLSLICLISVAFIGPASGIPPVWSATLALGATRLFEAPRGIENAVGYLDHSLAAAHRLWQLCHLPPTVLDGPTPLKLSAAPRIEWQNITYRYPGTSPDSAATLNGFNASAEPGKTTVFIGASGSGKTTAAQLLLRFDDPQSGHVLLNGTPVTNYTLDSLRSQVVLVSQQTQVLAGSIAENLRLGAPAASDVQLWRALDRAGFADEVTAMPEGLDTPVGSGGSELSGGQLQRLALARALLMNPRVLVLDEFTAHLSSEMERRIRNTVDSLQNVTVIEISHRLEHLGRGQMIYTVEGGRARRPSKDEGYISS